MTSAHFFSAQPDPSWEELQQFLEPVLALGAAVVVGIILGSLLIASIFMHIGASMAGIKGRTFGMAIGATIVTFIVSGLLSLVIPVVGWVIGLIVCPMIMMGIYDTSYGKAFLAYILYWIISIVGGIAFVMLLVAGISRAG